MEVKSIILVGLLCLCIGLLLGYAIGVYHRRRIDGGFIIFSPGEDGPKCTFKLNCDVEDFMQKFYITFKVVHTNDNLDNGKSF